MVLSPKEIKVMTLVAMGYSDKEIGVELKIAYGTVRNHVDKAVLKLHAQNRTHAVMIYKLMIVLFHIPDLCHLQHIIPVFH